LEKIFSNLLRFVQTKLFVTWWTCIVIIHLRLYMF
jgi:hypothetical protein